MRCEDRGAAPGRCPRRSHNAVGSVGVYASVAIRYGLGVGDWVAAAILVVFLAGYLLAASALLRRSITAPAVIHPHATR